MTTRTLLIAALLGSLGCGGANASGGEPAAAGDESTAGDSETADGHPSALLCSGQVPAQCGIETSECRSRFDRLLPLCVNAIASTVESDELTQQQREIAAGLGMLCSLQVLREQRALEGHPCEGEEIDEQYRDVCLLCSVAAGTVRVVNDPPSEENPSEENPSEENPGA